MELEDLTFNAIDVETANSDCSTICQIGIVRVREGRIADQWQTLINPECWFHPGNIRIHGILEEDVGQSSTLADVHDEICTRLDGSVLVSHTAFDRTACNRAVAKYGLRQFQVTWLDSSRIARRTWPERYGARGYGLGNIANDLGIAFRHHDALEDARAAAEIVLRASAAAGNGITGWLDQA